MASYDLIELWLVHSLPTIFKFLSHASISSSIDLLILQIRFNYGPSIYLFIVKRVHLFMYVLSKWSIYLTLRTLFSFLLLLLFEKRIINLEDKIIVYI